MSTSKAVHQKNFTEKIPTNSEQNRTTHQYRHHDANLNKILLKYIYDLTKIQRYSFRKRLSNVSEIFNMCQIYTKE